MKWICAVVAVVVLLGSCTESTCACTPPQPFSAAGNWLGAVSWPAEIAAPESLALQLSEVGDEISGEGTAWHPGPEQPLVVTGEVNPYSRAVDLAISGWRDRPSRFAGTASARRDSLVGVLESPMGEHDPVPMRLVRVIP